MDTLAEMRKDNVRGNPGEIVRLGVQLLQQRGARLGSEQWNVREQVFLAALDTSQLGVCQSMLDELTLMFPSSQRVARLRGLLLEAQGLNKDAAAVYDKMLAENANNTVAMKRKVCLLMSTGHLESAITQLVKYLDVFQADGEAWKVLAQLYIEAGNWKNASFCLAEVILSNPHSYLGHLAYAESLYTLGGSPHKLLESRKYYCQSLTMKEGSSNLRALFGLVVATKAVSVFASSQSGSTKKKNDNNKMTDDEMRVNRDISSKAVQLIEGASYEKGMDELVQAAMKRLSCT
uniref:ER membrane protein complex subunit 2 n=1 Tax=Mucochytrium quahogii TaxID=96639 RepID=A0A7S2W8A2_9STRA|mmetsp:Transcript_208/g.421  ORF Transcript_208/g.421 Transcript_208/m.421 type:complete len:291 (+) Transcript_208:89-961(+)